MKSVESSTGRGYEYSYDTKGQMTGYVEYDAVTHESLLQAIYLYNSKQQLDTVDVAFSYSVADSDGNLVPYSGRVYSYFEYKSYSDAVQADGSDMLSQMHLDGAGNSTEVDITYEYDDLYRMTEKVRTWNNSLTMRELYEYADKTSKATTRVDSFTSTVGTTSSSYTYTYDSFGNIRTITDSAGLVTRYYYDDQQQLIRENNPYTNKTYVYTYDRGGNRTSLAVYTYTTGSLTDLSPTVVLYTYEGDRLTAISSSAITYDALGNPLTHGNTTCTWQNGRQLATVTKGSTSVSYKYNDSGIRTSKTVNGIEHVYTLNGSQIVTESWMQNNVEHVIVYLYDESGAPIGMQYRNSTMAEGVFVNFYFEKNLFGDIVAVYNEAGVKIVSYAYDAWGNQTATWHNSAGNNIYAAYNPFRYRGYYYDTETGYYYLQSRYYNPQWGRFLNADGYINANGDLIGFNMYAYCSNNPVMYTDPSGEWSKIYDYFFKAGEKIASLCSPEFLIACSEFFEDVKNFNIFNDDEQEVLNSEYFSCYKGSLVIRHSSSDISSFAVFGMIILNRNNVDATTVKHEWGHNVQEKILGPAYLLLVAAPSVIYCATGDYLQETDSTKSDRMYFSKIWERTADFFGGVDRKNYDPFFRFDNFVPW